MTRSGTPDSHTLWWYLGSCPAFNGLTKVCSISEGEKQKNVDMMFLSLKRPGTLCKSKRIFTWF